jgi:hypothetical protein
MNINKQQAKALNYFTGKVAYLFDSMAFTAEQFEDGAVMVSGSNSGNVSIYRDSDFVLAIIGKRGGITVKQGSSFARKMIAN